MKELFSQIESPDFAARVGLASGYSQFLKILSNEPYLRALVDRIKEITEALTCLRQVLRLSRTAIDARFENRFDAAMAAYTFALSRTHPDLAAIAAIAAGSGENCWWSRHLSRDLLSDTPRRETTQTNTQIVHARIASPGVGHIYTALLRRPGDYQTDEKIVHAPIRHPDVICRRRVERTGSRSLFCDFPGPIQQVVSRTDAAVVFGAAA